MYREKDEEKTERIKNWFISVKSKVKHWFNKIFKVLINMTKENSKSNIRNIEIFKIKSEFQTPLRSSYEIANCKIGDYILIIDEIVWVQDTNETRQEQYAEAIYTPQFVRVNPKMFQKLT